MFIPELLPEKTRRRYRRTLFGQSCSPPLATLTPIAAIYSALGEGEAFEGGWWPSKLVHGALAVLIPQGSPAVDAVCALEPDTRVTFLGLAGALGSLAPGNVVEPRAALLAGSRHARTASVIPTYADATVATVTSLNESLQRKVTLRREADCVDMETGWIFAASNRQDREARAVLIVSDHLFGPSLHEIDLSVYQPAVHRVVHELLRSPAASQVPERV